MWLSAALRTPLPSDSSSFTATILLLLICPAFHVLQRIKLSRLPSHPSRQMSNHVASAHAPQQQPYEASEASLCSPSLSPSPSPRACPQEGSFRRPPSGGRTARGWSWLRVELLPTANSSKEPVDLTLRWHWLCASQGRSQRGARGPGPPDKVLAPLVGPGRYIGSVQNNKFSNKNAFVHLKNFTSFRGLCPRILIYM